MRRTALPCCGRTIMRSVRIAHKYGPTPMPQMNLIDGRSCCNKCRERIIAEFIAVMLIVKRMKLNIPRDVRNLILGYII